jgi:hypothetical protein
MDKKNCYSRRITSKEADNDFIFILKNRLSFFPDLGEKFELENEYLTKKCEVESYPCTCRGPDKPHEHYFIQWEGLESGDIIEIIKNSENEGRYHLIIANAL